MYCFSQSSEQAPSRENKSLVHETAAKLVVFPSPDSLPLFFPFLLYHLLLPETATIDQAQTNLTAPQVNLRHRTMSPRRRLQEDTTSRVAAVARYGKAGSEVFTRRTTSVRMEEAKGLLNESSKKKMTSKDVSVADSDKKSEQGFHLQPPYPAAVAEQESQPSPQAHQVQI